MREIKFRGIRVDNNEWVYGGYVIGKSGNHYIFQGNDGQEIVEDDCCLIHRDSVGQFTGLTDKNGKEIYEGDLVHFDETPYCVSGLKIDGKIVYYKGSWAIEYQATFTKDFHLIRKLFSSEDFIGSKSEITGNIHEGKEVSNEKL